MAGTRAQNFVNTHARPLAEHLGGVLRPKLAAFAGDFTTGDDPVDAIIPNDATTYDDSDRAAENLAAFPNQRIHQMQTRVASMLVDVDAILDYLRTIAVNKEF